MALALLVPTGDGKEGHQEHDRREQNQSGPPVTPAQTTEIGWLPDEVGERRTKWAGDDVRKPERREQGPDTCPR